MILQGFPYSNEQIITEKSTEEEISFCIKIMIGQLQKQSRAH